VEKQKQWPWKSLSRDFADPPDCRHSVRSKPFVVAARADCVTVRRFDQGLKARESIASAMETLNKETSTLEKKVAMLRKHRDKLLARKAGKIGDESRENSPVTGQ